MSYHLEKLGRNLRIVRQALGLSLRDMEKELPGISNSTFCRVENGKPVDFEAGKRIEAWTRNAPIERIYLHKSALAYITREESIPDNLHCGASRADEVDGCDEWIEFIQVVPSTKHATDRSE